MSRPFKVFAFLMLMSLLITIGLNVTGHTAVASVFSNIGPMVIMLGTILYIVTVDSKKRWPDVSWYERLLRLLSFYDK